MHTLAASSSITLLGAGLLGRLLATSLARQGHRVQIFEAGGPEGAGSAAYVAAAMLAPLAESAVTEPGVVCAAGGATTIWVNFPQQKAVGLPDWIRAIVSD